MKLMTEHRVRHLPVVESEKVVGLVSIGDLVNWTISAQDAAIAQMEQYIAGGVAALIRAGALSYLEGIMGTACNGGLTTGIS